jgi:hypothetical protein
MSDRSYEIASAARELSPEAVETLLAALGDDALASEVREILVADAAEQAARKAREAIAKKVGDDAAAHLVDLADLVGSVILSSWQGPARAKSEMSKTYKFSRAVNVTVAHPTDPSASVLVKFDVQTVDAN